MSEKSVAINQYENQTFTSEADALIAKAIDRNVPVETMEKLLSMRRELKAEKAKEEFDRAMSSFQAKTPTISKTKEVKTRSGQVAYRYAPIESIIEQVRDLIRKNGFSYSTNMELIENGTIKVRVSIKVTHEAGHSEITEMTVPLGNKTEIMSQTQVVAAASTFAKRYAFCNAFGILTGDEDTDSRPVVEKSVTKPALKTPTAGYYKMTYAQQKAIFQLLEGTGKTKQDLDSYIKRAFNKDSITKLTVSEADKVIARLNIFKNSLEVNQDEINLDEVAEGIEKQRLAAK